MNRYTATLADEPDNPWRWTGEAHHVYHAAIQAAQSRFRHEPFSWRRPTALTITYVEFPSTQIVTLTADWAQERGWFVVDTAHTAVPSIRGG